MDVSSFGWLGGCGCGEIGLAKRQRGHSHQFLQFRIGNITTGQLGGSSERRLGLGCKRHD